MNRSLAVGVLALVGCSEASSSSPIGAAGGAALAADVKPTGLAGLYVGQHFSTHYNVDIGGPPGSGYWTNTWDRRQLWLNGPSVLLGVPTGGFADSDFDSLCQATPKSCGRWVQDGSSITIAWNDGTSTSAAVVDDDQLTFGGVRLDKITSRASVTLDGSYTFESYEQAAQGDATTDSREVKTIRFHPDGTFEATALFTNSLVSRGALAAGSDEGGSTGTYRIQAHTLALTNAEGTSVSATYWDIGDDLSFVAVDSVLYRKE